MIEISNNNPMIFLNLILDDDLRERISTIAIQRRKEVSRELTRQLNEAICSHVNISGFRPNKVYKADDSLLIMPVSEIIQEEVDLLIAVVEIWAETSPSFRSAVDEFISTGIVESDDENSTPDLPFDYWLQEKLESIIEQFCEIYPQYDPQESALLLCWQTKRVPLNEETLSYIQHQIDEANHKYNIECLRGLLWEVWLSELQILAPDAPEWKAVDEFLAELYRLVDQKNQETIVDRTPMLKALNELRDHAASMLEYFGLSTMVGEWSLDNCPLDQIGQVVEQIIEFQEKLLAYQALYDTPTTNLQDEKQKRAQLESLEAEANNLFVYVNQILLADVQDEEIEEAKSIEVAEEAELQQETLPEPSETPELDISTEDRQEAPIESEHQSIGEEDDVEAHIRAPRVESESMPEESGTDQKVEEAIFLRVSEFQRGISQPQIEQVEEEGHKPGGEPGETTRRAETKAGTLEVLTVKSAAEVLLKSNALEDWNHFLWSLVAEADLTGAYWLNEAHNTLGIEHSAPPWLLKAIQGSFWLSTDTDQYVTDLLEVVNNNPQPQGDPALEMLGLAAALRPALIAPYSGLLGWLKTPSCCVEFKPLVDAISKFVGHQIVLRPEDVYGVSGADQRKMAIDDVVRAAKMWIEVAPTRRTKFKRASDVWRHLVGPKGELRDVVEYVSRDDRRALQDVARQLEFWQNRPKVSEFIDSTDQDLHKLRARPIVGVPRDQLNRYIDETCHLVQRWHRLVQHELEIETRGNWIFNQIAQLRNHVQDIMPGILGSLEELNLLSQSLSQRAASEILRHAFYSLLQTLQIDLDTDKYNSQAFEQWHWLSFEANNLQEALIHRLWLLPALELDEKSLPTDEDVNKLPIALRDSYLASPSIEQAIDGWVEKQDYRFVFSLLDTLQEETDASNLHRQYSESLEGSRTALRRDIEETSSKIEQAVVDGIIAEERSEFAAIVDGIESSDSLNIAAQYKTLEGVRLSLKVARGRRLSELEKHWEDVKANLETSSLKSRTQAQIVEAVDLALQKADTRLLEEYIARLTEIIDLGSSVDQAWQLSPVVRDVLVEFIRLAPKIESWLESRNNSLYNVAKEIMQGRVNVGINYDEISTKRREESNSAIMAWRQLKQQRSSSKKHTSLMRQLLSYLGFSFDMGASNQIRVEKSDGDWLYARANMSASGLARPIPQFGSFAGGRYHVICMWERPGADTISARLRELRLKLDSVIILYFGRLTIRQRFELIRMSAEQEQALTVLDEVLLIFLTQERDVRLPTFLRCSLPFAAVNPYTPFQAGDVPPEMFFGRETMARELQRPQGSSLVFGGRQLGKSALLRHVEREFNNPARGHFARVEDIKLLGDPLGGQNTDVLWRKIRDIFQEFSLISNRITTDNPEEIERYIREAMKEQADQRVVLLFDEADNFLDADAKENFRITERLRILMLDTQRRIKVVFAGLHNVQRFQGVANQPLAHFGTPLRVGPLEPDAAYQLVRQPLEYLGYRFSDDTGPLRILSYTNYHPGLIQLFCQALINRMRSASGQIHIPFEIAQADIEAVYRQVHRRIRERFDWTLALDMHYQAIAWTLIVDQMEFKDSYARPYPPGEILTLVREWWPQGFGDISTEELRSFLGEMEGLGVLVRNLDGHYRLRSPNLVRLMGSEADIETQLLELSEKQPTAPFEADHHHAPLDEQAEQYSPLTFAQERNLNQKRYGVGLIFGSDALGWEYFERTIQQFVPFEGSPPSGSFIEIPLSVFTGNHLSQWLDKHLHSHADLDHVIAYYKPYRSTPEEIKSLVQSSIEYCKRHQSKRRVLRLLFLFDANAGWVWHSISDGRRRNLEDSCDAVIAPRRWNIVGIRQRLSQHGKLDSESACNEVLNATGGWPLLLDDLFRRLSSKDDPRPSAQSIHEELIDKESELHDRFISSLGIIEEKLVKRVLMYILELKADQVPLEFISPELIGGKIQISPFERDQVLAYMHRLGILQFTEDDVEIEEVVKQVLLAK